MNNQNILLKRTIYTASILLMFSGLIACQSNWSPEPDFGSSVTSAVKAQEVNPSAPEGNKKVTKGLDGPSAKAGIDNYQKSFEVKAPTSGGTYPTGATMGTSGVAH